MQALGDHLHKRKLDPIVPTTKGEGKLAKDRLAAARPGEAPAADRLSAVEFQAVVLGYAHRAHIVEIAVKPCIVLFG